MTRPRSLPAVSTHARAAATTILLITLLALCAVGFSRGIRDRVDWSYWRQTAEAVQRDGLPPLWSETYGYAPHVPLLWMPLTLWLPRWLGVGLYVAACGAMAGWLVRTVGREWAGTGQRGAASGDWIIGQLVPVLLVLVHAVNSFHQNQLSVPVLFGVVLGLTLVGRGRPWIGGMIVGATISVKLVPLPIVGILLVKRCWRAAAAAAIGGALFAAVPCLMAYGAPGTAQATTEWLWRLRHVAPDSQVRHFPLLDPDRSQALVSVLNRALHERPAAAQVRIMVIPADDALLRTADSYFDTTPPTLRVRVPRKVAPETHIANLNPVNAPRLARLQPPVVATVYWTAAGLLIAATIAFTRRAGRSAPPEQFYADMSLALLAGVLLSPVLFAYYLVWAYPAWAIVLARRPACGRAVIALAAIAWLAAQVGLLSPIARHYGVSLWAALLLFITLVLVRPRGRDIDAASKDR